jgi:hypothetical protein
MPWRGAANVLLGTLISVCSQTLPAATHDFVAAGVLTALLISCNVVHCAAKTALLTVSGRTHEYAVVLEVNVVHHDESSVAHHQRKRCQPLDAAPAGVCGPQHGCDQHQAGHTHSQPLEQHSGI